ncbi:MAG: phosphoesterase, PA-phosphatase [Myxococcaceae bacterium]|nr:phosphoesterase, PA-phosphatase [Myxococcaceae bacterium]
MLRSLEGSVLLAVNGLRSAALDPWARWLNHWGIEVFLVAMLALALRTRGRRDVAAARDGWLAYFVALFVAETVVKPLVQRHRPTSVPALAAQLHVLGSVPPASSLSFPSGTAAACGAAAAFIWLAWGWRAGLVATAFGALVSLDRLYTGVHWPSDLVAGAALGAGVAYGVWRLSRWAGSPGR